MAICAILSCASAIALIPMAIFLTVQQRRSFAKGRDLIATLERIDMIRAARKAVR